MDNYIDFDPADYVENPVALARHIEVTQSYISKLEHTNQVANEALQKIKAALQEMRSE